MVAVNWEYAKQAAEFFVWKHGYTAAQAVGIVGNLVQESAMQPDIIGDQGKSVGLAQVNGPRLDALKSFAGKRDYLTLDVQLEFIAHELRTTEKRHDKRIRAAGTIEDAVAAAIGFERPSGWTFADPRSGHAFDRRLKFARKLAGLMAIVSP